jgi:hypothetical protein
MFKGMSKKKRPVATKKHNKEKRDLTSTHLGQLMEQFEDIECIMAPYNFE